MILIDNVMYLKKRFPAVWDRLNTLEGSAPSTLNIQTQTSRSGDPTLSLELGDGRRLYIHSKYNPKEEAEQFINKYEGLEKVEHVFFYGIGLGYHIDAFVQKYPNIRISLYEPEAEILASYLSRKSLSDFSENQLKTLFVERDSSQLELFITQFVSKLKEELLLIQLPSYERAFQNEFKTFSEIFIRAVSNRKSMFSVNSSFEKRWTYNSTINFQTTVKTPNILMQKQHHFKGKPAIIVAAGPSLQEELEHLKQIKEQGSAYIFTVGTAINALITNGIEPDAACTYDPSNLNRKVFERLHQEGISHIPLIYGTSVAYEVLKDFLGPKLHMVTNQDAVSNYYLRTEEGRSLDMVYDAASIAVVTLHLLYKLKCDPIILVGQNLAFKDNQSYASGANVFRSAEVTDREKSNALFVESVDGGLVETTKDFNIMRTQMEIHTTSINDVKVINTTNGGAKIANTTYMQLKQVMAEQLRERVVDPDWYAPESSCYDPVFAKQQADIMEQEQKLLMEQFEQARRLFKDMHRFADLRNIGKLGKLFGKFDKLFMDVLGNKYFIVYIKPMNKVYFELLLQKVEQVRFEKDFVVKARQIIQDFGSFVYSCERDALNFDPLFRAIHQEVIGGMQEVAVNG